LALAGKPIRLVGIFIAIKQPVAEMAVA